MDRLLPSVAHDDHWVQEEASWSPVGAAVWRRTPPKVAGGHFLGDRVPRRHGRALRHRVPRRHGRALRHRVHVREGVTDKDGRQPRSPLIHIAIVSLGPVVWNAAVLLVLFMFSLFLGPMLGTPFPKFGSVMAFLGHSLGVVGMIAFFEFFVCFPCAGMCVLCSY